MLFTYPAVFHKENDAYWVEFPDLEGCQTFGDTLNDTIASAQEALSAYLITVLENGEALATPSDITTISQESDAFTSLVSCDINPYKEVKAVKKTLTIPSWLNDLAIEQNINFSQILQEALLGKLQIRP